jgi:hypothetical protein
MFAAKRLERAMTALRKTLLLFWILTLGVVAALKYLVFTKLPSDIKRSGTGARGQWEH